MRISILGTGNVATVLGRLFLQSGHEITEVYGRNHVRLRELCTEWEVPECRELNKINTGADLFMLAVSDPAIPELVGQLRLGSRLLVHTAGAVPMKILTPASRNIGVLYPLQSLRFESAFLPEIPFLVDGNTPEDITLLMDFVQSLGCRSERADDSRRARYHVAAVFLNNFTNYLGVLAQRFCQKQDLSFEWLVPLLRETVSRLETGNAGDWQTGPAFRHDTATIHKHLELLEGEPELAETYQYLSDRIVQYFEQEGGG